jgi:Zn-dependent M16 (insulinase) family peptidase
MREMVFACGIEGSEADHADALEAMVLEVIETVASEGVETSLLEAVLHQLELHQREISGDSYPYGLQLILTALGCATHYSDPIAVLNLDPVLEKLQQQIQDPNYIKQLARRLLLENTHRVTLVMSPDRKLSAERARHEEQRLQQMKAAMSDSQKSEVVELAAALSARQEQKDDESILPKVELSDVPPDLPELSADTSNNGSFHCTSYNQGTNGLVYQQAIAPLPEMDRQAFELLPYYSNVITELGLGSQSYLDIQQRQSATCGSINAFTSMRGEVNNEQATQAYMVLSSKALVRNHTQQSALMRDTLENVRFDEHNRIRELVSQQRARREQSVTGNGHGLAMAAACAGMSPSAALSHQLSGLAGIQSCKALDDSLRDQANLAEFAGKLQDLHRAMIEMPHQFLCIAEQEHSADVRKAAASSWQGFAGLTGNGTSLVPGSIREARRQLWITNTQVNFCAQAFPTVPSDHPDAPVLAVLGGFMRNGYLHRAIREQGGAYGGGASQDSNIAAFRFYSYRDPRLQGTLDDFSAAVEWTLSFDHDDASLEQAILGVIGGLDRPSSPAGEAKQHFHNSLFGRSHEQRKRFRQRVLEVSIDDLRRVTQTYLKPDLASTAVITNQVNAEENSALVDAMGLEIIQLSAEE